MKDFLNSIFGDAVTAHRRLAVFTGQDSRTLFCDNIEQAVQYAKEKAGSNDVYFGLGLIGGNPQGRGRKENVCAIGALWADIDLMSSAHKDEALPETLGDIESLLKQVELEPSAIVNSGHGVHAYWFLKRPYMINNEQQRIEAEKMTKGWHGKICQLARESGWSMPNLGDITRILRVPDTWNYKIPDRALKVELLKFKPELRYDIETIKTFVPDCSEGLGCAQIGNLILDPDAQPPADKMVEAITTSEKFRQTWLRERPDLSDQSQSGYDLSLAAIAAMLGWNDQEITNLIIAARRKHDEKPEKALRGDYISRTLGRARQLDGDLVLAQTADVDISAIAQLTDEEPDNTVVLNDPGAMPTEMLHVPGFIEQVMDYTLSSAPYPNIPLAFAGALTMQAHLCGRKVRDENDIRPNIYMVALADSGTGKEYPRQVNMKIAYYTGQCKNIGDSFASGEGIEDCMHLNQSMLFQTDEIDGILNSINKAKDARNEMIMNILLKMYSSANNIYPLRKKAGQSEVLTIVQPSLTLYGTAVPQYYYEALSHRMLNNGFFARLLVIEAQKRGDGQEPGMVNLPDSIIDIASYWRDFNPGEMSRHNLTQFNPNPIIVPAEMEAKERYKHIRQLADSQYTKSQSVGDPAGMALWARAYEKARKLALIYACSENHQDPHITKTAIDWAWAFVEHHTRRMLFMAAENVSENPFHAQCLKLIKRLRKAPNQTISRSQLLDYLNCKAIDLNEMVHTLVEQGRIEPTNIPTRTKPAIGYRLTR